MRDGPDRNISNASSAIDAFELPNRRPTHILNTPALIAHYVFWYSPDHPNWAAAVDHFRNCSSDYVGRLRGAAEAPYDPDPKLVMAAVVNTYLQRFIERWSVKVPIKVPLFTHARERNDKTIRLERTGMGDADPDPSVAVDRTLALSGLVEGFTFELTADIFREHFTLSYRLMPIAGDPAVAEAPCLARAQEILADIVQPGPGQLERVRDGQQDCEAPAEFTQALTNPRGLPAADAQANYWIRTLYEDTWAEMFSCFDSSHEGSDPGFPDSFDPASLARKDWFPADLAGVFRNVVIRAMPQAEQDACQNEHPKDGESFNLEGDRSVVLRNVPNGVLGHVNERSRIALDGFARTTHDDPYRQIRARVTEHLNHRSVFFGRVLGFRANSRWIEDLQSGNATLSAMLDGLAIHGSTLGLHTTTGRVYPHQEVRHFVVYGGPSRQQLGRLCRELHAVGEYRLLALRGYRSLDTASRQIDDIYEELSSVDELLMNREPQQAIFRLNDASFNLQALKQAVPDGGLIHRLLQPESSLGHLKRHLGTLRISRVEGWRPYDEFVTRSVEPHVGYMTSIRAQLEELEEALRSYEARATTIRSEELTKSILEVVDDIDKMQVLQTASGARQERQGTQIFGLGLIAAGAGLLGGVGPMAYQRSQQRAAETDSDAALEHLMMLSSLFELGAALATVLIVGGALAMLFAFVRGVIAAASDSDD